MNEKTLTFARSDAARWWMPSKEAVLDIFERTFIIALFYPFATRNLVTFLVSGDIRAPMLVVSETLPIILIALRDISPNMSRNIFDWAVGLIGSASPLLIIVKSTMHPVLPLGICVALTTLGLYIQIAAKFSLGRSFGIVAANRGVKHRGAYRFVRHPMYAGYIISDIGIFLSAPSLQNAICYIVAFAVQVTRIYREEAVLCQDSRYRAFAKRVRFRLLPGVF